MASSGLVADKAPVFKVKSVAARRGVDASTIEYSSKGSDEEERVLLEVDIKALQRLLKCKSISVREFRGGNSAGKQCVQRLYLNLLSWQLATSSVK